MNYKLTERNFIFQDIPIMEQPDPSKIHLIAGIFLLLMLMSSVLIVFGVDTLKRYSLSFHFIFFTEQFLFRAKELANSSINRTFNFSAFLCRDFLFSSVNGREYARK